MEFKEGKLIVKKNKKGHPYILLEISDGNNLPLSDFKISDDKLHNVLCQYYQKDGKHIINVNGLQIHPKPENQNHRPINLNGHDMNDNFSLSDTKLPSDVREITFSHIDNFSLKLNKAAPFIQEEFKVFKDKKLRIIPDFSKVQFEQIQARQLSSIKTLNIISNSDNPLRLSPTWHFNIGLGHPSVYETSMTLHHIYGIPYIPASAIKGVVRSHIITECFGNDEKAEKAALKNDEFVLFFGNLKQQGKIIFFDAFPESEPKIKPDVMNVHYQDYYNGSKPPADYLSPNPIFFLTVTKCKFSFFIGTKPKNQEVMNIEIGDKTIFQWLKDALTNHGIGAKTAVGYGYMKEN